MANTIKVEHRDSHDCYTMYTAKNHESMREYFMKTYEREYGKEIAEIYGKWIDLYTRLYIVTRTSRRKNICKRLDYLEHKINRILKKRGLSDKLELNAKIQFTDIGWQSEIWDKIPTIE